MSHRHLHGEQVFATYEVRAAELSEALSEAALLVRDLEKEDDPYAPFFSIVTSWDLETDQYDLTIFVRG